MKITIKRIEDDLKNIQASHINLMKRENVNSKENDVIIKEISSVKTLYQV